MNIKNYFFIFLIISLFACSSNKHLTDFELQNQLRDEDDSTETTNYITSTIPIDSVNINKLIFDVWRIETDKYPDKIKEFTRVYDSLGHFVTNIADPYKKNKEINYFAKLDEGLGKIYNKRIQNIPEFTVREFGANDSIPYNIVLAVDNSGSMSGVFNTIMDGAELFASMKFKYDKLAVTSFSDSTDVRVPLSDNTKQIISMLRAKRQQGLGRLSQVNDALFKSMNMFEFTSKEDPRVLVVFTDGDDNISKKDNLELIKRANEEKIHIFCVAFGYYKDDGLRELAKYTGGKFYKAYTKEELTAIFRDIYMSLRYYYLVEYKPPRFMGTHFVYNYLSVPGRKDSLVAQGEYDMSDFTLGNVGDVFEIPILFDFNKADLKPESSTIIDAIVDQMMIYPKLKIEIQGHTDNVGGLDFNQVLSEKRAAAVKLAITSKGIEPERIRTRGFGMTMPTTNNDTEQSRAKNRRTMFVILAK
jgi:outer membrane protein OmpA-like peptidoglycan-associated protein/Mg-chelatase subunit ChlD